MASDLLNTTMRKSLNTLETIKIVNHIWWSIGYWRGWFKAHRLTPGESPMFNSQEICRIGELRTVAKLLKHVTPSDQRSAQWHDGFKTGYISAVECGLKPQTQL
jgi:hypothetical protein